MAAAEQSTYAQMMSLITGFWVSQVVRAAAHHSLAEHLRTGPRTAEEVAELEGSVPDSTFRLMRAGVSIGLLTYAEGKFAATPLLATLDGDSPLCSSSSHSPRPIRGTGRPGDGPATPSGTAPRRPRRRWAGTSSSTSAGTRRRPPSSPRP
jgi:hypothetical protein